MTTHTARIREIYIGPEREGPMTSVSRVQAIAGKGLTGDRYANGLGSYSKSKGLRDVTLMEIESLWDFYRSTGIDLHPSLTRRNIITEGICLPDLIGQSFTIGSVPFLALRPCPPCTHLARLVGMPHILPGLARSAGIYAQILEDGMISVEDPLLASDAPPASTD